MKYPRIIKKINIMKRTITLFLLLSLLATAGWAQSDGAVQDDTQTQPSWKDYLPRHEAHFTIGDPIIAAATTDNLWFFTLTNHDRWSEYHPWWWFEPDQYDGITWSSFALNAGYSYRVAKWFWVGGNVSYCGFYKPVYDRPTGLRDHYEYTHIFSVIPQVRFSWVNTPIVTCYSEIGVGFSVVDFNRNTKSTFVQFAGQLTFVGVQVGYKWYGSAEFGVGPMGLFRLGFGYRFNGQKNN